MPEAKAQRPASTRWHAIFVLVLLTALYVLAAVDRQILAVMVDPIRAQFALTDTQLGILSGSAFALVYALAAFPAARLADRQRRTLVVASGLALWSACTGLFAFARSWWQLFLCRMGLGLGEACLSPMAVSLLADYFPARHLGKAMAVYILGVPVGYGVTSLLGGAMFAGALPGQDSGGALGALQPWQLLLLLLSGTGFVLLLLFVLVVREPRRQQAQADAQPPDYSLTALRQHLASEAAVYGALALVMLASALLYFGVGYWVPSYFTRNVSDTGPTAAELLYYWGMVGSVAGALGVLSGGVLADYLGARHADGMWRTLGIGLVLAGTGFTAFSLVASQYLALVLLVPGVFGNGILQAAVITAVVKVTPPHMRGQTAALGFLFVNLVGAGFGPVLVAWLGDTVFGGLAPAMALTASITSVAALLMLARTAAASRRLQDAA